MSAQTRRGTGESPDIVPTKKEVIRELRLEIECWRNSYREIDGVIRDEAALHSIRCIQAAVLMVRAYEPDKRKKRK